jgi:hypothetical protein
MKYSIDSKLNNSVHQISKRRKKKEISFTKSNKITISSSKSSNFHFTKGKTFLIEILQKKIDFFDFSNKLNIRINFLFFSFSSLRFTFRNQMETTWNYSCWRKWKWKWIKSTQ